MDVFPHKEVDIQKKFMHNKFKESSDWPKYIVSETYILYGFIHVVQEIW